MSHVRCTRLLVLLLAITAILSLRGFGAEAQEIQINKDNRTVAITTTGEASLPADLAVVSIGFSTYGQEQDATYAKASEISNRIISALTGAGVAKEAVQSTEQALRPLLPNNDGDKTRYAEGNRFQFTQSWQVTVAARDAASVLHVAIPAGANESGNINWQLKDEDALEAEAARKALEHARQVASSMAAGLGAKLGALLYASNQTPSRLPFTDLGRGVGGNLGGGLSRSQLTVAPLSVEPQHISRTATVYAAFVLE